MKPDPEVIDGIRRSIRVRTAAVILDCDETQIRALLRSGQVEGHRIGTRGVRVYLDSLDAYRERRAIVPAVADNMERKRGAVRQSAAHREAMAQAKEWGIL
jgi:excisionase family DNA binding protein